MIAPLLTSPDNKLLLHGKSDIIRAFFQDESARSTFSRARDTADSMLLAYASRCRAPLACACSAVASLGLRKASLDGGWFNGFGGPRPDKPGEFSLHLLK